MRRREWRWKEENQKWGNEGGQSRRQGVEGCRERRKKETP